MAPIDFTGKVARLWLKVEGVEHLGELEVLLGDSNLANATGSACASAQSQQWMTDGDWVVVRGAVDARRDGRRHAGSRRDHRRQGPRRR